MGKFLKDFWGPIIITLLFILQTANLVWCLNNPNMDELVTILAAFCDGFIFSCLIFTLKEL